MIAGYFHQGSGLGNQLHRYVATRVLATDRGVDYGMIYNPDGSGKEEGFKGKFFLGQPNLVALPDYPEWQEKKVIENGVDIRSYDPEINFVEDDTIIEGEFQDPRYFEHRLEEIDEWLKVEPIVIPDDTCVIGFRGGEYSVFPELYLTKEYWEKGIEIMKERDITKFEVHTDDPERAREFFPDYPIIHDVGINWRSMRYARHAIIANSSFYILPRLLRHYEWDRRVGCTTCFDGYCEECKYKDCSCSHWGGQHGAVTTIAPRYWARRITQVWALPSNFYKQFLYV